MAVPTYTFRLSQHGLDLDPGGHHAHTWPTACRLATTANITIATGLNAGDTIDGVTLAAGDRVLVKNQSTASQNGIYIAGPTPTRAEDYAASARIAGSVVVVVEGSAQQSTAWMCLTNAPITVGSTSIDYASFGAGSVADILDLPTAETDDTLVLAPDGAGGVEFRAETGGGGAPTTADYLVGTAQGGLSAEIVVGATPGGELGGTWASPTVDGSHSGSTHAATQAAAEATAASALSGHTGDTSDAHDASAISFVPAGSIAATDVQAAIEEVAAEAGGGGAMAYVLVRDEKAQGTDGGNFTSGAWRTRVLNTEVSDTGSICSLASNQITLAAGTYRIKAIAPVYKVDRHQLRLQNVTDATTVLVGQSAFSSTAGSSSNVAQLMGRFTIAAGKALELQHQAQTTQNTNGFGVNANFTTEVFAIVELWQE